MLTLKTWLTTIYQDHSIAAAIAAVVIIAALVLAVAEASGVSVRDVFEYILGVLG